MLLGSGNEDNIKWKVKSKGRMLIISVDNKNMILTEEYECQFEPIFGYDCSDIYNVNKILDKLIEVVLRRR